MNFKDRLKKISEYEWELPLGTKPCMKVPGRIFLSERLLKEVEEGAIEQVANVACLPGIQKHSLAMPDMHFGYGFPIGGVAAISYEEGGISPGGVGFDINCIGEDSEILTRDGYRIEIKKLKDMLDEIQIISKGKTFEEDFLLFLVERNKNGRKIFEITTNTGRKIVLSEDHPILTTEGFKKAKEISLSDKLIVFPFEGVKYERKEDIVLNVKNFENTDPKIIKKLMRILPLKYSSKEIGIIARLFGYILRNGCISKVRERFIVRIFGKNKKDLEEIRKEIEKIGFKPSRIYYKSTSKTQKKFIKIVSKSFALLLIKLGMPVGRKISQHFEVPEWIKEAPAWIKRNFLAGILGAEMSFNFIQPSITIRKNKEMKSSAYKFLADISQMLLEFGVETTGIYEMVERERIICLRLSISNNPESLISLYSKIGFEYNKENQIKSLLIAQYLRERLVQLKGKSGVKIAIALEGKCNSEIVNRKDIGITINFEKFETWVKNVISLTGFTGFVPEEIESIKEISYEGKLFDLGIEKNHNFISNSIVVHNCGVRILTTNLKEADVRPKLKQLLETIFRNVPSGVGSEGKVKLTSEQVREVLKYGAKWAVENGYGWEEDLEHIEDKGSEERYADPSKVSSKAIKRGMPQLGSLGAGNHFLEIQRVEHIYLPNVAKIFGIEEIGQITVMIHTGSRGLGHQVATDYLQLMEREFKDLLRKLPDRELAFAPSGTKLFENYFAAMNAAANFAFANRQMIMHWVRESFEKVFGKSAENFGLKLIYDITHNMAKLEEHEIDGKKMKVLVHRKGATRAFGPKWEDVPKDYKEIGQPVLIPGSMGTASYILIGTDKAEEVTFSSIAHGAGRVRSRASALKEFRGERVASRLANKGILVKAVSWRVVAEEAPEVYKDVDEVVKVCEKAGIARIVAKLRPIGVVKG
jgi:tRNA-splicing ligase RtcB